MVRFRCREAWEFFLRHGVVATLRTWPYERVLGKTISVYAGPFRRIGATSGGRRQ